MNKISAYIRDLVTLLKNPAKKANPVIQRSFSTRMYNSARGSRLTSGFGASNSSADSELATSLSALRSRSRQLMRDASYAKRAKTIVVNNIIGSGIGMQAQIMTSKGRLNDRVNDEIEEVWERWSRAENCHTGGSLSFTDYERMAVGQVFDAGEVFNRKYYTIFGESEVPFALEIIEAEKVPDNIQPVAYISSALVRMGIESDSFYRPIAYYIRKFHPGDIRLTSESTEDIERVPANLIIHLRIIDRWPQTRGEPWLHTAARKLNDIDGYSEAEIIRSRGAASYMGIIERAELEMPKEGQKPSDIELAPGTVETLLPGEKFNFVNPNSPNSQADPFLRFMLREIAAGVGVSYESLSRDYSQSNYSSSRLALLDDRDLWKMLQLWFIRTFRNKVHREWLQQAVLSRAIKNISIEEYSFNPEKFNAVRFKPRGWSWIDPTREVEAYKEAVKCGFTTVGQVISLTASGIDLEDILNERRQELDQMEEKDLKFITDPAVEAEAKAKPPEKEQEIIKGGNGDARKNT